MNHYEFTTDSPRPRAEVFAYLADLRNAEQWYRLARQVTLSGAEDPETVGATFTIRARFAFLPVKLEYETVELDAPRTVAWEYAHRSLRGTDRFELEDAPGGGTTIRYTTDFDYRGLHRINQPFADFSMKPVISDTEHLLHEELAAA